MAYLCRALNRQSALREEMPNGVSEGRREVTESGLRSTKSHTLRNASIVAPFENFHVPSEKKNRNITPRVVQKSPNWEEREGRNRKITVNRIRNFYVLG